MPTPSLLAPVAPAPAPRLALVLGSGGVRSIAGLGIAEVLEREGLAPDLVVGCSSGALFGAGHAMGLRGDEALRTATRCWRPDLTEQRRRWALPQLLLPRLLGFGPGFALRDARRIEATLVEAFGDLRLETLPTALRVAVTEADTGRPTVLRRGRVVDAVLASMAVPFLFPAVPVEGRRLWDGVVGDPLPIAAAADARVVVALDLRGDLPRRIDRPSRLVAQVTTALVNNLLEARLEAARASGRRLLCLELEVGRRVGLWETAALPELYRAGQRAAEAALPALHALVEGPVAASA